MHFPHHVHCRTQKLLTEREEPQREGGVNATVTVSHALLALNSSSGNYDCKAHFWMPFIKKKKNG